ncbi:hypothetical protein DFH08DRAFT_713077, partial [Mycena albidolilacea]
LHLSDGHVVKTSKTVKLLGVHLDHKLRWHEQSAAAIAKGEAWLIQTGRIAQALWGIGARNMQRLYLGVCVPRMLYAADVFLSPPAVNRSLLAQFTPEECREWAVVKKLCSIRRCAALAIMGALHSTPTEVLDAYANLLPVTHLINKVRAGAALQVTTRPASHPMHAAVKQEAE